MTQTRLTRLTYAYQDGLSELLAEDLPYFPIPAHWGDTPAQKAVGCLLAARTAEQQRHITSHWAAIEHDGAFVGFCQYITGQQTDEFGIVLKQSAQGKGIAKYAAASLLYSAFGMGRTTACAMVAQPNLPSRRLMAALGFGSGNPLPEDESYFHDAAGWPVAALWFEKPLAELMPICMRILGDVYGIDRAPVVPGSTSGAVAATPHR